MRRTIFLALLAALLFAPAGRAADPTEVIRDCADDGVLQGDYSASELRKASNSLPTDVDEYSDCRDVLSRAIADRTSSSGDGSGDGSAGGSGSGSSGPGTGGGTDSGTPDSAGTPIPEPEPTLAPAPEAESKALDEALNRGAQPVEVDGRAVSPGESRLAASVGRNAVPSSLFTVFGLLVLAGFVALGAPLIRRLVTARKQT